MNSRDAYIDDVIITGELDSRASRLPDFEAESQALASLAEDMGSNPEGVLLRLVELARELTHSDSSGISILEHEGEQSTFRWVATAGAWAPYRNGTMPREKSPCSEVIARKTTLLMKHPERAFPALLQAQPGIGEGLLAPFEIAGAPAGTVWVIKHDDGGKFDAEDARLLESLARFASLAHQVVLMLRSAQQNQLTSDTRLRALTQASLDVFYVMSPNMQELRALSGGNFLADTTSPRLAWLEDYIPIEDQARTLAAINQAISTKGNLNLEHRVRQIDGTIGWAVTRAVPILDAAGEVIEWFGAAQNITAAKQAEAALRESEERQAFLLRLSDALRAESSTEAIANRALRMLFETMGLDRCYIGIYRLAEDIGDFPHQVHGDNLFPLPAQVRLSDFPEALLVASDRTLVVEDVAAMEGLSDRDRLSFESLGMRALIAATLRKGENNPLWAIVAAWALPRAWTRGEISLVEDVTERTWAAMERARTETALRNSEAQFRQFSDASTDILWIRDADTLDMLFASPAFDRIYGILGPERGGNPHLRSWIRVIGPEYRKLVLANFRRVRAGERIEMEFQVKRASDGALRWIHNTDFPLQDGVGKVRWVAGLGSDITEAKEAADRQGVLVGELQHRTRNLIAVVQSLSNRTLNNALSLGDFGKRFGHRLAALSRVQGLLSHLATGEKVTFDELLRAELAAHGAGDAMANKVDLDGPSDIPLRSGGVQTLALAIHELSTNAVKYGALRAGDGHLKVRWRVERAAKALPPRLHIEWVESGVAMPEPGSTPRGGGYGRELIERALPYQLQAETTYELGPQGVRCVIIIPISQAGEGSLDDE